MSCKVIEEAKRMTGQDFRETLVKFFTNEMVEKILRDKSATKIFQEEAMLSNVNSKCLPSSISGNLFDISIDK